LLFVVIVVQLLIIEHKKPYSFLPYFLSNFFPLPLISKVPYLNLCGVNIYEFIGGGQLLIK
ncbi:MAG: hypothetical protein ACFFBT_12120, partial [Promethearchaeota archaeon]